MKNNINIMSDKTLIKGYIEKGKVLFNNGEIDKAFKNFNKAILLDNKYADAYFVKAQAHIEIYEAFEAEECIMKYLKLVPDDPLGYWKLIDINDLTGDFDKCIYYCEKLIQTDGKNANTYFKKAQFLAIISNFKEALECFNICLILSPYFYDALCGKAKVLFSLHNRNTAIDVYNDAIKLDNTRSVAYLGMSEVHLSLGNNIIALEFAKKAYEIEPSNEWYKCHYKILKDMNTDI